jgi:Tfp pilus assembly protein PilF
MILMNEGKVAEAEAGFREALKFKSDLVEAHNNLGVALVCQERYPEGAAHFAKALALKPGYAAAKDNLAGLIKEGKIRVSE